MPADTQLVLGDVAFHEFEIPEEIAGLGGRHRLNNHTLIGGKRVIDAMGPDPDDPHWHGRFRGNEAVSRARAVERLYISGEEVTLSWLSFNLQVVVAHFECRYLKRYEIPYKIRCMISEVDTGSSGSSSSLGSVMASDVFALNLAWGQK